MASANDRRFIKGRIGEFMGNVREGQLKLLLQVIEDKKEELKKKESELSRIDQGIQLRLRKISFLEDEFHHKQTMPNDLKNQSEYLKNELSSLKKEEKAIQKSFENILDQLMLISVSLQEKVQHDSTSQNLVVTSLSVELGKKLETILHEQHKINETRFLRQRDDLSQVVQSSHDKIALLIGEKIEGQFERLEKGLTMRLAQREEDFENLLLEIMKKERSLRDFENNLQMLLQKIDEKMRSLDRIKKTQSVASINERKPSPFDN
jgi:DNA repair exonuclease SbcCD ATPase subunit